MIYCAPKRAVKRISLMRSYYPNSKPEEALDYFKAQMEKKDPEGLKVIMRVMPKDIIRKIYFFEEEVNRIIAALGKPIAPIELESIDSAPLYAVKAMTLGKLLYPKKAEQIAEDVIMDMLDSKWLKDFPENLGCLTKNKLVSMEVAMLICNRLNRLDVIGKVCENTINVVLFADEPGKVNWEGSDKFYKREFASMYYPKVAPARAQQNLYQVIKRNEELDKLLTKMEPSSRKQYWTREQVRTIFLYLGTPDNPKFSLNNIKPKAV